MRARTELPSLGGGGDGGQTAAADVGGATSRDTAPCRSSYNFPLCAPTETTRPEGVTRGVPSRGRSRETVLPSGRSPFAFIFPPFSFACYITPAIYPAFFLQSLSRRFIPSSAPPPHRVRLSIFLCLSSSPFSPPFSPRLHTRAGDNAASRVVRAKERQWDARIMPPSLLCAVLSCGRARLRSRQWHFESTFRAGKPPPPAPLPPSGRRWNELAAGFALTPLTRRSGKRDEDEGVVPSPCVIRFRDLVHYGKERESARARARERARVVGRRGSTSSRYIAEHGR